MYAAVKIRPQLDKSRAVESAEKGLMPILSKKRGDIYASQLMRANRMDKRKDVVMDWKEVLASAAVIVVLLGAALGISEVQRRSTLEDIRGDIQILNDKMTNIESEHSELRELYQDVGALQSDVNHIGEDVGALQSDVKHIREDVGALQSDVKHIREDINRMLVILGSND